MLKVTAPIELNMRPEIVTAGEGFCNRMTANYRMIDTDVSPSDMLHVTTEPPEFYFGEETRNTFSSNTQVNIREENVANIINNLVNRIMVSPDFNMSYQDRVYISNALKKLGIKDEHTFMKQLFNIREEINNTNQLIDLYFAYGENIKNLVDEYITRDGVDKGETKVTNQSDLHLHEDIYNRLETGLIYSIVQNFTENAYGFDVISNNEMQISEQKTVLENILLKELQSEARGESIPLVYRSDNYYEDYDFNEDNSSEEKINEVINSATLLRFITNAIETKVSSDTKNINNWFLVRPGLSSVIENTLNRMESNLRSENITNAFRISNTEIQNRIRENEINIINNLMEGDRVTENYETEELTYHTTKEGDSFTEALEQLNENLRMDEKRIEENNIRYEQIINEEREKVRKRLSPTERRERQRQDALMALESPEEVIMTLRMEQELANENEQKIKEAARNAAIPKEDRIITLIDEYIKNPSQGIPGAIVTHDDFSVLAGDIERVEMLNKESAIESEIISQTIERVSREVSKEIISEGESRINRRDEGIENLNLVHRTTENIDLDEVTEELTQRNQRIIENIRQNEDNISNINRQVTTTVNENHIDYENIERNLERMVTDRVGASLNNISDQVYRKIENKLQMEKRRRGL